MSKQKQKGTGGENEVVKMAEGVGLRAYRTSPGMPYDVVVQAKEGIGFEKIEALATRPDHGFWLVTVPLLDFLYLVDEQGDTTVHIEVKRYRRFAHHTIYTDKFGRSSNG